MMCLGLSLHFGVERGNATRTAYATASFRAPAAGSVMSRGYVASHNQAREKVDTLGTQPSSSSSSASSSSPPFLNPHHAGLAQPDGDGARHTYGI
jgi:hypothetical protein